MEIERIKIYCETASSILGSLAIVIGSLFAGYQYLEKEGSDRAAASLGYVERYEKAPIFDARMRIEQAWLKNETELKTIQDNPNSTAKDFNDFSREVVEKEGVKRDVVALESFFSTLEECISSKICDENVAIKFLQADAKAFFQLHFATFEKTNSDRGSVEWGARLLAFAQRKLKD